MGTIDSNDTTAANPKVSAVIVTFNRPASLRRVLDAVAAQTHRPDEVHVVDNAAAPDGVPSLELPSLDLPVHYHAMADNLGYAAGLSVGMRAGMASGANYVWLLDDDSVPGTVVLDRCLDVAQADPSIGIVGLDGGHLRRGVPVHERVSPGSSAVMGGDQAVFRCQFVLVDGALVTGLAIQDIGYPRGDFFMMMEDIEYSRRLRRAGWEVVRLNEDLIDRQHLGSSEATGSAPPWRGYYQTRNHLLMALEPPSLSELAGWGRRQAKFVVAAALSRDRPRERIALRLRGAWDGMRGVTGRTVEPR